MSETVDPWAPDPTPGTLPHKPYTLPAIGTELQSGRKPAATGSPRANFERERGPLYEVIQKRRIDDWAQIVTDYEADPRRFARAWHYLNQHPIYYWFRRPGDEPAAGDQERNLVGDAGLYEFYFQVSELCAERCLANDCDHPTRGICWAESGPRGTHDYRLDVWGDTYESCILQLARLVWTHYGNDATLARTANHFDEEDDDD